jgi:prevent-host-death family protein
MNSIPEIIPISDIRQRQNEILRTLASGPVVLTQHGKAAAVMIDPAQWNSFMEELEDLRDLLTVYRQDEAIASGELTVEDVDTSELRELLKSGKMAT